MKYVAAAAGGELRASQPDLPVENICTDSKQVKTGDLFVAIKGERFDGHDFVNEVAAKNVTGILIERKKAPSTLPDCPVLLVDDSRAALGKIAAAYRSEFHLPVFAVGGSNGKTTTKELVASVLKQKYATLWSEASFNNDIGVPATLMRLNKSHQAAVVEVGTNHPGELAGLVRIVQPMFGILTNIGREHLEFFGDLAGVAQEEGWLAELLPPHGTLFLNGDNEWSAQIANRTKATVVRVGLGDKNDWRARSIRLDKGGATFQVEGPAAEYNGEYRINLLGRHQVQNTLFAIAAGAAVGVSRAETQRGLTECQPAKMRMQYWEANGVRVLDDAYNANADSVRAALETLCDLPLQGRRVAILGDMAELGAQSGAAHMEVGRYAAELKIGQLFTVGPMAAEMAKAAREAGLTRVIEFADVEAAVRAVKNFLKPGDVVLLKASRSSRLERIAETLKSGKN